MLGFAEVSKVRIAIPVKIGFVRPFLRTKSGTIVLGDSLEYMSSLRDESLDLIVTSPPFGLVRKKDYGNVESHECVDWFKQFGVEFRRLLKPTGSSFLLTAPFSRLRCSRRV